MTSHSRSSGEGSSSPSRQREQMPPSTNMIGVPPEIEDASWEISCRGIAYTSDYRHEQVWYKFDLTHHFHRLARTWLQNNEKGIVHSHDHDYVDVLIPPYRDSFPLGCTEVVLGAKIFCVGGDNRIQGFFDINDERVGSRITHRNSSDNISSIELFPPCDITVSEEEDVLYPESNEPDMSMSQYIHSLNIHSLRGKICAQLISPRLNPKVVSIGQRLYFFSGNKPPENGDEYVPFVEYFDPATGSCYLAKDPPFPRRLGSCALIVAPLLGRHGEQKILVMSKIVTLTIREPPPEGYDALCVYDVVTDSWEEFDDPGDVLYHHLIHMIKDVVSVAEDDSIYWLGRDGMMFSYNWREKVLLYGTLEGLEHEHPFQGFSRSIKTLIHIKGNYFCIVWESGFTATESTGEFRTRCHVTCLRVSKESNDLSVEVVECFGFVVDEMTMKTALLRSQRKDANEVLSGDIRPCPGKEGGGGCHNAEVGNIEACSQREWGGDLEEEAAGKRRRLELGEEKPSK